MSGGLPVDAALINAELLPDLFALHVSAYKALEASASGKLRARSLHAELVFGLSGSKHVRAPPCAWGGGHGATTARSLARTQPRCV